MAVLGPGSGLGVATAVPCGDAWTAVGGEGGHVTLAAQTATEAAIIADYRDATGHCSAEKLLSGPGLARIYASLAKRAGTDDTERTPDAVTAGAARGDAIAIECYAVFFALLGAVAGNLALTVGARGGVFIGGGIVPRVLGLLESSPFRERFVGKGRYRGYLDGIPTAAITTPTPAFLGLRKVLGPR
jgi:glucokinase